MAVKTVILPSSSEQVCVYPQESQQTPSFKSELSNLSHSSKSWWGLIKSVSDVCFTSIPSLTSNGHTADTAPEKAECLNSVFASKSCVQNPLLTVPTLPSHTQLSLDSVSFSSEKVESLLSNLDSDSATGPDGISPHVLKTCSSALAHPLFPIPHPIHSPSRRYSCPRSL